MTDYVVLECRLCGEEQRISKKFASKIDTLEACELCIKEILKKR